MTRLTRALAITVVALLLLPGVLLPSALLLRLPSAPVSLRINQTIKLLRPILIKILQNGVLLDRCFFVTHRQITLA